MRVFAGALDIGSALPTTVEDNRTLQMGLAEESASGKARALSRLRISPNSAVSKKEDMPEIGRH